MRRSRSALAAFTLVWALGATGAQPADAQTTPTTGPTTVEPPADDRDRAGDGAVIPDAHVGPYPTSRYDIGYDAGAWNNIQRKFFGLLTELAFASVRWLVGIGVWVITWAYGFGIVDALGDPATRIAALYQDELIGPVGLRHAAIFYALAWAGYQGLRGRLAMAFGELVITVIVATLGVVLLANPAGYLDGTLDTTARVSATFLALGTGVDAPTDTTSADAVLRPLTGHLHAAFVEQPHELLNWGETLTGACATVRDQALATGPHGDDGEPRRLMRAAGCDAAADFNHDPTAERLGGALLTAGAAGAVVALLALIAVTLLVAQVMAVVLFAVAPFALLGGLLPGAGREVLWRWLAGLVRVVLAVVGMSFVLSLLLLTVDALLAASADAPLIERFALLILVTAGMFIIRKRVVGSGAHLAERMSHHLSVNRPGATRSGGWLAPAAVGGISGYAVGASLRDSAGDLPGPAGTRLRHAGQHPRTRSPRPLRHPRATTTSVAAGGQTNVVRAALARAGERVAATPPGRVARTTGRVATGAATAAYKTTVGLPVHGPRAYRAATATASAHRAQVSAALRDYRSEYAANLARLRPRRPPQP